LAVPLALLAILLSVAVSGAQEPGVAAREQAARSAAEKILASETYQKVLPVAGDEVRGPVEANRHDTTKKSPIEDSQGGPGGFPFAPPTGAPRAELDDTGHAIISGILWSLAAIGGAIFIYLVARNYSALVHSRKDSKGAVESKLVPETVAAGPPLSDAEQFAAAGQFEEAIHALLLHALQAVERKRERPFPRNFTSRAIARAFDASDACRAPLSALVGAVEIHRYGGRPCGPLEYIHSRSHYDSLRAALGPP
jgi:hypothetical protein